MDLIDFKMYQKNIKSEIQSMVFRNILNYSSNIHLTKSCKQNNLLQSNFLHHHLSFSSFLSFLFPHKYFVFTVVHSSLSRALVSASFWSFSFPSRSQYRFLAVWMMSLKGVSLSLGTFFKPIDVFTLGKRRTMFCVIAVEADKNQYHTIT